MFISCNLFFTCGNYLYSTLQDTINYNLFLSLRMPHAEITDRELSFANKMSLQTLTVHGPRFLQIGMTGRGEGEGG